MNNILMAIGCTLVMMSASSLPQDKGWRGIVPLHSTCADAKRLLGISKCETGSYDFDDERAFIWFSEKPCADGWNVRRGTITSIKVYPKRELHLADLAIDTTKFRKETSQGEYDADRYIDEERGLVIATREEGRVESIAYIPTKKDRYLRYPNSLADQPTTGGDPHSILKFDEYGDLAISEEDKRLDDFALKLRDEPNARGYIITYAGRRARAGQAEARAGRAKSYLVTNRGIESARIVTVDGGYREKLTVELFLGAKDAAPIPSPAVCPSDVRILKNGKAMNKRGQARPPR